jgi:hypothetical protein
MFPDHIPRGRILFLSALPAKPYAYLYLVALCLSRKKAKFLALFGNFDVNFTLPSVSQGISLQSPPLSPQIRRFACFLPG